MKDKKAHTAVMEERSNDPKAAPRSPEAAPAAGNATEMPVKHQLTPEEIDALKDKAAKADEYWARLLREAADFDNYKKRAIRERQEAIKFANEGILLKLLPIMDNFEMALAAVASNEAASADSIKKGVEMIHSQLKTALAEAGLQEIDATNKAFDPNFHEAVSQEATAEIPEGNVTRQIRKGYKFQDRLLRPATVVVAKKP